MILSANVLNKPPNAFKWSQNYHTAQYLWLKDSSIIHSVLLIALLKITMPICKRYYKECETVWIVGQFFPALSRSLFASCILSSRWPIPSLFRSRKISFYCIYCLRHFENVSRRTRNINSVFEEKNQENMGLNGYIMENEIISLILLNHHQVEGDRFFTLLTSPRIPIFKSSAFR